MFKFGEQGDDAEEKANKDDDLEPSDNHAADEDEGFDALEPERRATIGGAGREVSASIFSQKGRQA